jgi:DNA-binding transcriptional ArsR family regulator
MYCLMIIGVITCYCFRIPQIHLSYKNNSYEHYAASGQSGEIFAQPNNCTYICNHIVANKYKMETRRDIFQAIADPTRRAIIALIALQAMTPNALAEHFNTSRQAVSKHIQILTECDLVKQEQQGREIYYSLQIQKMKEIDKWLDQFRKLWETQFNQLDKVLATIKKQKK